jgi:hypothetical protein
MVKEYIEIIEIVYPAMKIKIFWVIYEENISKVITDTSK